MASHGKARHTKRLAASRATPIKRKGHLYLKGTSAGRHDKSHSMPALVLLRDALEIATDKREAKRILSDGRVLVDGKKITDVGFPIGLMDVISIPVSSKNYRIVLSKGKLTAKEIPASEAKEKLCRIIGKKIVKGGGMQLQFHDGRSALIEREEDTFKLGDTVKIAIPKQKIAGIIKMQKGSRCYIFNGRHAGEMAELQELLERAGSAATEARMHGAAGDFITRKGYVFVVDDNFDA